MYFNFTNNRACGGNPPRTVRSNKGVMTLNFKTNGNVQRSGFKAVYYFRLVKSLTTLSPGGLGTTKTTTTAKPTTTTTEKPCMYYNYFVEKIPM